MKPQSTQRTQREDRVRNQAMTSARTSQRTLRSVLSVSSVVSFLLLLMAPASAQTAPEGNAHPRTQNVTMEDRDLPSPFGDFSADSALVCAPEDKWALAQRVDLTPLRDLAVFHNGRVKIVDTLARETVQNITGRRAFRDYLREKSAADPKKEEVRTATYDPLFTLLDLTIDPGYYINKPLIGVEYLPLREALLRKQLAGDDAAYERWLRLGQVTPMTVGRFATQVANERMSQEAFRGALSRVEQSMLLFAEGKANYVMVAPADSALPWQHISSLPEDAPARKAAADLGAAWRARDATKVTEAAAALARELPKVNAAVYPAGRRGLELTYNRVNAFEWGFWAYLVAFVTLVLAFGTARPWLARIGACLLIAALAMHAFGFVTRCVIAERFAIQNQFESMTGLS